MSHSFHKIFESFTSTMHQQLQNGSEVQKGQNNNGTLQSSINWPTLKQQKKTEKKQFRIDFVWISRWRSDWEG